MPKKIKTWNPRLRRATTSREAKAQRDKEHDERHPWRAWYKTARWQALRNLILNQDPYCTRCERKGIKTPSTTVNHIKPSKGDPELFWDMENLEGVCAPCHNSEIQSEERLALKR